MLFDAVGNLKVTLVPPVVFPAPWTPLNWTAGFTSVITQDAGFESILIELNQNSSVTAGAVTWQGTYDGINWITIPANQVLDPTSATFSQIANPYTFVASTNKAFLILGSGYQAVRALESTPMTGAGASVSSFVSYLPYTPINPVSHPNLPNLDALLSTRTKPSDQQHTILDSGTVTSITNALPTGTNIIGHVINDASAAVIGHVIADSGSTTVVTGTVAVNQTQVVGNAVLTGTGTTGAGSQRVTIADTATASSSTIGSVSLGQSSGKTVIMKPGTLVTSSTSADQVILTYTVTTGKTFYLQYLDMNVRLQSIGTTNPILFGNISLENPSGTKLITEFCTANGAQNSDAAGALTDPFFFLFNEPVPIASATVIRVVCTPNNSTSYTWTANFGGYEK